MSDGKLIFDTSMDTNGFSSGLKRINSVFAGMTMFKGLELALGAVKNSFDAAFNRMDTAAQFSRVMTTMTGDVKIANDALKVTNGIVKGTAYGLDTAAKSVQNFVSRGMTVNKATDSVRLWGDAVAFYGKGTNEELSSVTDALAKMQTMGKVQMREMQMLFHAGIPAVELYARSTKQSTEEVRATMERGELDVDQFISAMNKAFESGVEGFPKVAGAAKAAGASWAGTFDNMKAAIARGTESMITNIDRGLRAANLPSIREMITNIGKGMESALKTVGSVLGGVMKYANVFVPIIGGLKTLSITVPLATKAVKLLNTENKTAAILAKLFGLSTDQASMSVIKEILTTEGASKAKKLAAIATIKLTGAKTADVAMTNAATLATNGLGLAMIALPIVGIIAGIVTLVSIMGSFSGESNATANQIQADTDRITNGYNEMQSKITDSAATYRESAAELQYNSEQAGYLVEQLTSLSNQQEQNAGTAANQKAMTEQLVAIYPELGSIVDQTTGILHLNDQATLELTNRIIGYVEALKTYEMVSTRYKEAKEEESELNVKEMATANELVTAKDSLVEAEERLRSKTLEMQAEQERGINTSRTDAQATQDSQNKVNALAKEIQGLENEKSRLNNKVSESSKVLEGYGTSVKEAEETIKDLKNESDKAYGNSAKAVLDFAKQSGGAIDSISADISLLMNDQEMFEKTFTGKNKDIVLSLRDRAIEADLASTQEIQAIKDGTVAIDEELAKQLYIRSLRGQEEIDQMSEKDRAILERYTTSKTELEEEYKKHYDNLKTYAFNGFEGIKEQTSISMDDIINNMNAKAQMVSVWGNNMSTLARVGLHEGFIQQLKDAGPESAVQTQRIIDTLTALNGGVDISLGVMTQEAQDYLNLFNGSMDNAASAADDAAGKIAGATGKAGTEASGNFKMDPTQGVAEVQRFGTEIDTAISNEFTAEKATITGTEYGRQIALNIELGFNEGAVGIGTRVGTLMGGMGESITSGGTIVQAAMSQVMAGVGSSVVLGASSITPGILAMMNTMTMGIMSGTASAQGAMTRVMTAVIQGVRTGAAQVQLAIRAMMSDALSGILAHGGSLRAAGISVVSNVADGIRTGRGAVYNAAYYVMQGMSEAMTDYTPFIYSKADTIAAGVADRLKKGFDSHSPSRVTYKIFSDVMQGMINPMDDRMPELFARVEAIKNGFTRGFSGIIANSPTIMSAYASGSKQGGRGGDINNTYNQELIIQGDINDPATLRRRAKDALRFGGMANGNK